MIDNQFYGDKALQLMIGREVVSVSGLEESSENVDFFFSDGSSASFYHDYSCCENVYLYDFELTAKNIDKLKGAIINDARADSSDASDGDECSDDSGTWTFYNINTSKGCINMRWLGESNGYYGEDVDVTLRLK